ncbi:MAG: lipoyl(octanoyl) transferase LipB [Candidatus Eremiobacteraeota bacterium]|nr:lipoyl(octanoyl) transferase LipB [Candidatus Eremiobacteraeota bacterium]
MQSRRSSRWGCSTPARLLDLGRRSYKEVWDLQRTLHAAVASGEAPDTWIVVEHEPVVTIGRQGKTANLILSREALAARGVELYEIERGGDVTYHGPGQVVVYPILRLPRFREVVPLVRKLEDAVLGLCRRYGIEGERWREHAGVWVGRDCLCAIGLAVQKMTSLHGIALNASTELDYDRLINPCGLTDRGITSLSRELGRTVSYDEAKAALLQELDAIFDLGPSTSRLAALRSG